MFKTITDFIISSFTDLTEPPENSAKAKLPTKKDPLTGNGLFVVNVPNVPENTSSMSSRVNLTHSKSCMYDCCYTQLNQIY